MGLNLRGVLSILFLSVIAFSCSKEKSFELGQPTTPGSGGSAVYVLSTNGADCMNAVVNGDYSKGTALNAANTVEIEVSVNTIGTWSVNSASVAGFYFQGSGTFVNTGIQTITLVGSGTPNASGAQSFELIVGNTACSFVVNVTEANPNPNPNPNPSGVYLPMTENSWWSYMDPDGDTLKTTVSGSTVINGQTYTNFVNSYEWTNELDTSFYRKDGSGNYYQIQDLSDLMLFGIEPAQSTAEILFLKDVLNTNDSWNSDHAATMASMPVTVRFAFTVINGNQTLSIGSNNFTDVARIQISLQLGTGGIFNELFPAVDFYYAKGVGLIRIDDNGDMEDIRYWQVM